MATPEQIAHIEQYPDRFKAHTGYDDVAEYFADHEHDRPTLYEGLCADLDLTPITTPGGTMSSTETEDERVRRLIDERLSTLTGQDVPQPQELTIDDVLAQIDPRDSETAQKLFVWLQKTGRLHRVGTLDEVGYMLVYSEPKGSSKEGWTHGGTQGDRIVNDALEKAQAAGAPNLRGLCSKCFSPVTKQSQDGAVLAESPREGDDPAECPAGGPHQFAS